MMDNQDSNNKLTQLQQWFEKNWFKKIVLPIGGAYAFSSVIILIVAVLLISNFIHMHNDISNSFRQQFVYMHKHFDDVEKRSEEHDKEFKALWDEDKKTFPDNEVVNNPDDIEARGEALKKGVRHMQNKTEEYLENQKREIREEARNVLPPMP